MSDTLSNLQKAIDTFREREKVYKTNFRHFGNVMAAIFPDGLTLKTPEQWNRFGIFFPIITKLTRYAANPHVGHVDSIHDVGVYAFMLEELDTDPVDLGVGGTAENVEVGAIIRETFCPKCGYSRLLCQCLTHGGRLSPKLGGVETSDVQPESCHHVWQTAEDSLSGGKFWTGLKCCICGIRQQDKPTGETK